MKQFWKKTAGMVCGVCVIFAAGICTGRVLADQPITLWLNGKQIQTDVAPVIIEGRTMVPIRAISEGLGLVVNWDGQNRRVLITGSLQEEAPAPEVMLPTDLMPVPEPLPEAVIPVEPVIPTDPVSQITTGEIELSTDYISEDVSILGTSVATADQLRQLALKNNPDAPDLAQLYLDIGEIYGIRGDIAFCQAAKETGWWKFGNLVKPWQNNYCGLGATGAAATGEESLNGADPSRVWYIPGLHGAIFSTPADGVEAQIQHLYAYCCSEPLPEGRVILDPRFTLVTRGIAPHWQDLNGRWAVPGVGYGESILNDYYIKALNQ